MSKPKVYFTRVITPESLVRVFEALGVQPQGRVAVKISTGEPGGHNYLKPELIQNLVQKVQGDIVECNTAYGGRRGNTEDSLEVAKEHGFTDIAPVAILDAEGEIELPTPGASITTNYVGKGIENYDTLINLAHFKGHVAGGFGGVLKNQSIGLASIGGKANLHSAGQTRDAEKLMLFWSPDRPEDFDLDLDACHDDFIQGMADAAKSVADYMQAKSSDSTPRILYIDVMNNLSRDCDCSPEPEDPCMQDIGILASLDPVALDQACIDLIWNSGDPGRDLFVERVEEQHGRLILERAAAIGLGSRDYELVEID